MFYTSPSDIRSFLQCPRQWAFKKVHRQQRVTIPGMQQGTALDLKVQRHFEGKGPSLLVDPVVDAQMRALVPELPPPGTSRQARLRVELVPGEIGLQGALDYFIEPNVIGDTKTTALPGAFTCPLCGKGSGPVPVSKGKTFAGSGEAPYGTATGGSMSGGTAPLRPIDSLTSSTLEQSLTASLSVIDAIRQGASIPLTSFSEHHSGILPIDSRNSDKPEANGNGVPGLPSTSSERSENPTSPGALSPEGLALASTVFRQSAREKRGGMCPKCGTTRAKLETLGWILSEETLPKDHQALAYTLMVCRQTGMDHAICRWHYTTRKLPKPEAWTVGVYVLREDAERWAEEIAIPAARAMLRLLAERPPVEEIPHEPEGACGMGSPRRCGYAGMCPVLKGPIGTGRELMV